MADKIQFYPVYVSYKIVDGRAVIRLFGRTTDGKQICVLDKNFEPYFWIAPKEGKEADIEKKIKGVKKDDSEVVRTEIHKKKFMNKGVNAVKVFTKSPKDVPVIRNEIKEWKDIESINEYDVKFVNRYLIDKKITPLTLVEAEGEFVKERMKIPAFDASRIEQFSDDILDNPRILAFDIETYNPSGKTVDYANPIIMISFYGEDTANPKNQPGVSSKPFEKVITWKEFDTKHDYIEFVDGEEELIQRFKEVLEEHKPDIITGYYTDGFDFPYLEARAKKYKIELDIGLDYSSMNITKTRAGERAKIMGIFHLDVFKFVLKTMGRSIDAESYKLDAIAEELLGEKKIEVELNDLAGAWDENKGLEKFSEYNLRDSYLTYKLAERIFPNIIELVKIVGQPPFDINRMGFSQLVEGYILKQAPEFNIISLNKPHYDEIKKRQMFTYKGAFVYEPKPGLYDNIAVFDFRSLYPTIISSHNISLETLNCSCCKGKAEKAPVDGENYWYCKKKKGFIPELISDLITRRMRIKEIIKEEGKNPLLDARENSLKLLANSFYGYLGFYAARFYSLEAARSVTAWGRHYINKVIDAAEKEGFKVIYGDTDSVFFTFEGKSIDDAKKFSEKINQELPGLMELEFEGLYPRGIFVFAKAGEFGAKKKYALLNEKGGIKIRGFEMVRRNWSLIAKEVQQEVIRLVLTDKKPEKAVGYVKNVIDDLRGNRIPIKDIVIQTQLTKEISSYDARGPHVAVAERMEKKGLPVGAGSLIKYVIVKGKEKIRDRARLPDEVSQGDYDPDYYIEHQVIPAVERIFNIIGFTKEDLSEEKSQSKLAGFM